MNKFLFTTLLLVGNFILLSAQNNFTPGFIVNNSHDTIYGWIDFNTNKTNQKQCRFKVASDSEVITYLPDEILKYRFTEEGKFYVSHEIEINNTQMTVFVEFLLQGKMNLYYYEDKEQSYYFFEDENKKMIPVTKAPDRIDDERFIVPDNKYKGTLRYIFKDYPDIANNTDEIEFNQKSMIHIAKNYHDAVCVLEEECIIFMNTKPDKKYVNAYVSVYGGMQQMTYYFRGFEDTDTDGAPLIGLQLKLLAPRWSKSFSWHFDFSFSKISGIFKVLNSKYFNYEYKAYPVSGKTGIRYTYPRYKIRPYIETGFSYNNLIKATTRGYVMKRNHTGGYGNIGVEYNIQKKQYVFLLFFIEKGIGSLTTGNDPFKDGNNLLDNIEMWGLKAGYTF